ncbi:hypothetical protein BJ875DRAFT_504869 [Amylocarpus encephaloides]|uniref:WSC domain-containing protein n=1 Tax=Amylocarpus encephaloides TaxID=45428 RepID=A0A9P8C515_9HELO|nr:hypothetical protein BJ875DRAFT_504869 [Amylocarpus encephaloides]
MFQLVVNFLVFASQATAFFRLPCAAPIVIQRADPVVNPGMVSSHVHTIMGGNGFGFEMDFASTQKSTCSSCTVKEDMSNYWVPTLYYKGPDGKFTEVTQTGGATIYYLQRTDSLDPEYPHLTAFPNDLRMVAGDPFLRSYKDTPAQNAVTFACLGTGTPEFHGFPDINCPDGLRAQVFFPSCWNGKDMDSPNHKSHLAYPAGMDHGACPKSHPKRFISIFYEVIFNTPKFADKWHGKEQPFFVSNGDPTGYGYHADFVNGWKEGVLQKAINDCNIESGVIEECKHFSFITNQVAQSCRVPPSVHEQTSGTLNALPGCNPIQPGPALAKPQPDCPAPSRIGSPLFPFTDLTKTHRFAYIGCGLDLAGKERTLKGAKDERKDMTVQSCIKFCDKSGFNVAGLEHGNQCFCDYDRNIPNDRRPVPDLLRDCSSPCAGNPGQVCGGGGLISLYQRCNSIECGQTAASKPLKGGSRKRSDGKVGIQY